VRRITGAHIPSSINHSVSAPLNVRIKPQVTVTGRIRAVRVPVSKLSIE
jgi:hypothetical protein